MNDNSLYEEAKRTVLVVDDDAGIMYSIKTLLSNDFNVFGARSARQAIEIIKQNTNGNKCIIDVVFSDICMDEVDGLELLEMIKRDNPSLDVVMMTGYPNPNVTIKALRLGATDFIIKPFKKEEVYETIQRVSTKRKKVVYTREIIDTLKKSIQQNYEQTTRSLIYAIDAKDNYTKEHSQRVADLAREFGCCFNLDNDELDRLHKVAVLHDIGKIGIRENILRKQGHLIPEEWEEVKRHPLIGYKIVQPVSFLGDARKAILHHHEHYDGSGYPDGLVGEQIPLQARMLSIIDSFDAMVTNRPYRDALSLDAVLEEITKGSGTQFDPQMVDSFVCLIKERKQEMYT